MHIYITKFTAKKYLSLQEKLDNNAFSIGYTWEDYLNGQYVELTPRQIEFKESNPRSSVYEVFHMQTTIPTEEDIDAVRTRKIQELLEYDSSENVNSFYLNNVAMWLDKDTRVNLHMRLDAELALNRETTTLWYNDICFELSIDVAINFLNQLEVYTSQCYDNTQTHRVRIYQLDTIESIEAYDYTIGYPDKLRLIY